MFLYNLKWFFKILRLEISLTLFSIVVAFLFPIDIMAQSDDGWEEETIIDVSIIGTPVVNLDSSNTLLRLYVDITNFDPADGYYFLRIIQSETNTIISEENIIIREKSNGKAGADVAHLVTEDELLHTGVLQGEYDVIVFSEYGAAFGNSTFSIIKPSVPVSILSSEIINNQTYSENSEVSLIESSENESELINEKKIPDWVKNIFVLYSYDEISENELINALTYLIEQGIIEIN